MGLRIEYLITVDERDAFCKSVEGLANLVRAIDGVSINRGELRFEGLSCHFDVQMGEIERDKQRYFHLKMSFSTEGDLSAVERLMKGIRSVLSRAAGKPPQVLWDGLSFMYAQRAYPIVHEIENTMRKLITKFMVINVGLGWAREAVPKEVLESVRSKDAKLDHNYLFEVDFIQLSSVLFKEYSTVSATVLIDRLRKAKVLSDLVFDELKLAVPRSNWDRFFSKVVSCESEYLKVRWERLYEKRNQIAHNRQVSRDDYVEICRLRDEIAPNLVTAIESLDKVVISEDDREMLSEDVATAKSEGYGEFLSRWKELHLQFYLLALAHAKTDEEREKVTNSRHNIRSLINMASRQYKAITPSQRSEIKNLIAVRNYVVHQPDVLVPVDALSKYLEAISNYTDVVRAEVRKVQGEGGEADAGSEREKRGHPAIRSQS